MIGNEIFGDEMWATYRAVADRVVPAGEFPGAWDAGAGEFLTKQLEGDLADLREPVARAIDTIDAAARAAERCAFVELAPETQDAIIARLEDSTDETERHAVALLIELILQSFYANPENGGNRDEASWKMIGYTRRPGRPFERGSVTASRETATAAARGDAAPHGDRPHDAIVVGAGAGGGVVACRLAEAGMSVLLLERGENLEFREISSDHLRNQRFSRYGHNAGPDADHPRVAVEPDGSERIVLPHEGGYQNNAATVGGGTRVYGAMSWRYMAEDFRMASTYGVPAGSSLADWPIGYADLEPYYDRAEWELGVSGDGEANVHQAPRRRGYPMPPMPPNAEKPILEMGAATIGINTFPPPLMINSVAYAGRNRCAQRRECVGFPCPTGAKASTHNTVIPRALATGNCTLLTRAMVHRIITDSTGTAVGVVYSRDNERHEARAGIVVCSAGAVETARLLLNSPSSREPTGLGNRYDQVGRNLQGHHYPAVYGVFRDLEHDLLGPGPCIATCAYNHHNASVIGGAMIANEYIRLPVQHVESAWPPGLPRWGAAAKEWMRYGYTRTVRITGPVQEIPNPDGRVTLDPTVRDRWGMPVARLSGTTHPETLRTVEYIKPKAIEWLEASGAERTWTTPDRLRLSGGQHQAGTCRMGNDPSSSVTEATGRVHGHKNLFIADASLHVTNGGFNPSLTILALAYRVADAITRDR